MELDVGSGIHRFHPVIQNAVRTDVQKTSGNIKVLHVVCDAHHLPFKPCCFHKVRMSHVAEHLDDPVEAFKEALRVLEIDGQLDITVPHRLSRYAKQDDENKFQTHTCSFKPSWFNHVFRNFHRTVKTTYRPMLFYLFNRMEEIRVTVTKTALKKNNVSIVLALHNEEELLPYALNPLRKFRGEIIFILDRCKDNTEKIVNRFKERCMAEKVIVEHKNGKWKVDNPVFDAQLYGSSLTSKPIVVWSGGDIVLNREILMFLETGQYKTPLQFNCLASPNMLTYAYHKLLNFFVKSYTVEVFRRNEIVAHPGGVDRWSQWHGEIRPFNFHQNQRQVYHLRKTIRQDDRQFLTGYIRGMVKTSFLKVLLRAILFNQPHVLRGYLHYQLRGRSL